MMTAVWRKSLAALLPDDARVTVKSVQLVIDAAALKDPKAKSYTPQELMDLSFLP